MIEQAISLLAAAMILLAFLGNQRKWFSQNSLIYLLLNIVGSVILGVIAFRARQAGITVLEVAWAIISLIGLATVLRKSLLKS